VGAGAVSEPDLRKWVTKQQLWKPLTKKLWIWKILSHPQYPSLLGAFIDCQKLRNFGERSLNYAKDA